jgi:polysaccharide biosynthesis/export protein
MNFRFASPLRFLLRGCGAVFLCGAAALLFVAGPAFAQTQTTPARNAGSAYSPPQESKVPRTAPSGAVPSATAAPAAVNPQAAPAARQATENYVLNRGDTVKLSVFQEPNLDAECTLSKSGEASFPLIGSVQLAGRTVRAAEKVVEELYNKDYLVNPRVSLALTGYAQHFVTVSGAVANPRVVPIPLDGRFDVLAAIAAAGGTTEKADLRSVILRHATGGNSIRCDVAAMQANPALAREIQPGDSITVSQKVDEYVVVSGEVTRPSRILIPETGKLDVLTAITMAGDYTRYAKPKNITLTRNGRIIPLDGAAMANGTAPAVELRPGDHLHVGKRIF